MDAIEVKTRSTYWWRVGPAFAFPSLAALVPLIIGSRRFESGTGKTLALLGLVFVVLPIVVMIRSRGKWIRTIDASGVTLRGGRHFAWSEFQSVRLVRMPRYETPNHYELVFRHGVGRVFPEQTANVNEVLRVLQELERNPPK